ncbi:hypothetical protein DPEC_G00228700 [Dallia pectoralis]|uniref:Uncharacterized protein n=1 Tax=Dallia pectoralis TaxID=75939 RepID=A0ACC2G1J1_DALPE|nr:hypothetical protein DPEC_G00228700 [Dallia pectoralis]
MLSVVPRPSDDPGSYAGTATRAKMSSPSPHDRSSRPSPNADQEEEDPVDKMISRTGCGELHYAVQECMAEHQDWRRCQGPVQTFKDCMVNFQKARKEQLMKQRQANDASTQSA